MTDQQLLDVILNRAVKCVNDSLINDSHIKNVKLVLNQQYGKKLYFAFTYDSALAPLWITFKDNSKTQVFVLPELPDRLMDWKHNMIHEIQQSARACVEFDISTAPKEIVHIFFSAIISALNTPGMSVGLTMANYTIFGSDETYEEVQIEADLLGFEDL